MLDDLQDSQIELYVDVEVGQVFIYHTLFCSGTQSHMMHNMSLSISDFTGEHK